MGNLSDNSDQVDRYRYWVVPETDGAQYVPDADTVAKIVDLAKRGWLVEGPRAPYDPDRPFYYSTFPGPSDAAEVQPGDARFDLAAAPEPVIRRSRCREITVMVTYPVLVAPTARAQLADVRCAGCGEPLLPAAQAGKSRLVPPDCPACANVVTLSDFGSLPLFRFAVILELWYPPPAGTAPSVDPDLLALLKDHTGHSFRGEAQ